MPALSDHQSNQTCKLLLVGDSSTGKTGALASLAASGYKLRVLDYDNGMDIVANYLRDPNSAYYKKNPKAIENVQYVSLQDGMRPNPDPKQQGKMIPSNIHAFNDGLKLMTHWKEKDGVDLGPITSWGPDCVLVIDSLSFMTRAAENAYLAMNGLIGKDRTGYDWQRDVGVVQGMVKQVLDLIFDVQIKCNVVLIAHIQLITEMGGKPGAEGQDKYGKGYPAAIGRALSPHIPKWFNNSLTVDTIGSGNNAKHKIFTQSRMVGGNIINAKSSAPLRVKPEYDIEWGLAEYFAAVKGEQEAPKQQPAIQLASTQTKS